MVRVQTRCGSRILPRGWGQFQRLNGADMTKESELVVVRVEALEAFRFSLLIYALSHILETLFLSFLTFS